MHMHTLDMPDRSRWGAHEGWWEQQLLAVAGPHTLTLLCAVSLSVSCWFEATSPGMRNVPIFVIRSCIR